MIVYSRFDVYKLYRIQNSMCKLCNGEMNIHDMETENILDNMLICYECLEEKKNKISDCDKKESILDMDLRPLHKFMPSASKWEENEIVFSKETIHVTPDTSYTNYLVEQHEVEEELDPEYKIQSSWYHRAMIGDENREIYDDGEDTDFEAAEELRRLNHELEEDDEENDNNAQLVFDHK